MGRKHDENPPIEYIGIPLRFVLLILGALGAVFSVLTLGGCEFFRYAPKTPPEGVPDNRDPKFLGIDFAFVGLDKYDPNLEGCRDISDDFDSLTWQYHLAQVCGWIAAIVGIVGFVILLVDFFLCRFMCGRLIVWIVFFIAFICQCLTMLVYTAKVCDPNYKNGPFPCSPEKGTWFSAAAIVLFLICAFAGCCIPKPLPLCIRLRKNWQEDTSDGWCGIFKSDDLEKVATEKEEEEEEEKDEDFEEMTPEERKAYVDKRQTYAMVTTALLTARKGKMEEIEKELELLEQYKEHIPEEEYDARVAALMGALPKPNTYDAYTKTTDLVVVEEEIEAEEEKMEEEGEAEGEEGEGEEKEKKKGAMAATGAAIAGGAAATVGFMKRPFKGKKTPEEGAEVPDEAPPTDEGDTTPLV